MFVQVDPQLNQISPSLPWESASTVSQWFPMHVENDSNLVTDYNTESYLGLFLESKNPNYQVTRCLRQKYINI